jgi:hypothetical protein
MNSWMMTMKVQIPMMTMLLLLYHAHLEKAV